MGNPFDRPGQEFMLTLANPNPKARRRKDGPRYFVEFEIDAETFENLMSCRELAGMVIEAHCTVTGLNDPLPNTTSAQQHRGAGNPGSLRTKASEAAIVEREQGRKEPSFAQKMHINGYYRNPKLWTAMEAMQIYTQREHKAWIEQQPCHGLRFFARSGPATRIVVQHTCRGDIVAHHTPSAALPAAGTGAENPRKPPHWWTVPACAEFHDFCHRSGGATRADKQRLVEDAAGFTAQRVEQAMKTYIGLRDGEHLTQGQVEAFEKEVGLR